MKSKPKVNDRIIYNEITPQPATIIKILKYGYEIKLDDGRNILIARREFKLKR